MSLPNCTKKCKQLDISCPVQDCRMWIDYPEERNCCLVSIEEKGKGLTLYESADRLNIHYLKVRQIEKRAMEKIKRIMQNTVK